MAERYEDVQVLTDHELRELLESGRPEERVWAIWALALRSANVGELAQRAEPDPGVRRNLAVVLAGHGHLDLLVALARRDPAPGVRAAAMQLVSRFAIDDKLPPSLVADRVATDGSEVRLAVLATAFAGAPDWLGELCEKLLEDPDSDVRYEAFEALTRIGRDAVARCWLEEAPESEARLALMRWSARGRVRACAEALAGASRRLRRLLIESVRVATWHDLAPVVGDEMVLVRALARRDPTMFDHMPLANLIRVTLREPGAGWVGMIRDRLASLDHPDDDVAPLLHDLRELCARQLAELDQTIARTRKRADADASDELEALQDQRVMIESALEHASRMLVH